jgi:hypothetical protein
MTTGHIVLIAERRLSMPSKGAIELRKAIRNKFVECFIRPEANDSLDDEIDALINDHFKPAKEALEYARPFVSGYSTIRPSEKNLPIMDEALKCWEE